MRKIPRLLKILIALVMGYSVSPIDLIPDFIPILGQLDDTVLILLIIAALLFLPKRTRKLEEKEKLLEM